MVTLVAVVTLRVGATSSGKRRKTEGSRAKLSHRGPESVARSRRKTVHTIEPLGSRPTFRSVAAVSGAITEAMPMTTDGIEKFEAIVITANRVASGFLGPPLIHAL